MAWDPQHVCHIPDTPWDCHICRSIDPHGTTPIDRHIYGSPMECLGICLRLRGQWGSIYGTHGCPPVTFRLQDPDTPTFTARFRWNDVPPAGTPWFLGGVAPENREIGGNHPIPDTPWNSYQHLGHQYSVSFATLPHMECLRMGCYKVREKDLLKPSQ